MAMPRQVTKRPQEREAEAWTEDDVHRFLEAIGGHRWEWPLDWRCSTACAASQAH